MNSLKTFLPVLLIAVLSVALFSAQKTETPDRNSPMRDKVKTREVQATRQNVEIPVMATAQNISVLMKEKKAVFLHYGFAPLYNKDFEKKYGVKIINKGCVMLPGEQKDAERNNKIVASYLTKNFGEAWKQDLGFKIN